MFENVPRAVHDSYQRLNDTHAQTRSRRPLRPCHVLAIAITDGNIGLWALGHAFGLLIVSCKVLPLENAKANVSHIGLGSQGENAALAATEVNRTLELAI